MIINEVSKFCRTTATTAVVVMIVNGHATAYQLKTLASFPGGEVAWPSGALAYDGNNLYGTTQGLYPGVGTVFRVSVNGSGLTAIHYMDYPDGGFNPYGGVTLVGSRVVGVTYRGGPAAQALIGDGTVFSLNPDGSDYQLLKTFGYPQGTTTIRPHETVVSDGTTLYGTTTGQQSSDYGSVFRINLDGTGYQVLHSFNGSDGSYPVTRLLQIGNKLYGATAGFAVPAFNNGTIFSMSVDGTNFQTLHTFAGVDGVHPEGDLALVGSTLYGVTRDGATDGAGTIFRVNIDGSAFQTIHSFPPGSFPWSGLKLVNGKLFGTTVFGGSADYGTIFSINPDGTGYEIIHTFHGSDGIYPTTRLLAIGSRLYGTTERGGASGVGTVFSIAVPESSSSCLLILAGLTRLVFWRHSWSIQNLRSKPSTIHLSRFSSKIAGRAGGS